jgi:hypothetical protein
MDGQARISSLDDIVLFRANLITFLTGARVAVEECSMDAARLHSWIEGDRRRHWESECSKRRRRLDEAKQALFTANISANRGPSSFHQLQVHHAEREFDEAKRKLDLTRAWARAFENRSQPLVKQVEQLQSVLSVDMARAVQFLNGTIAAVEAYADRVTPGPTGATANPPGTESASTPEAPNRP